MEIKRKIIKNFFSPSKGVPQTWGRKLARVSRFPEPESIYLARGLYQVYTLLQERERERVKKYSRPAFTLRTVAEKKGRRAHTDATAHTSARVQLNDRKR